MGRTSHPELQQFRAVLLAWMQRHSGDLPSMHGIAVALNSAVPGYHPGPYAVCQALDRLAYAGLIAYVHGTRSRHRGHCAVRIVATGKELRTPGCPLDLPADRPVDRAMRAGVRQVAQ